MTGYQYTLIKYMRNAASGECVNIGPAFLRPEERFLCVRFNQSYNRISEFFLNAFEGDHYCNMVCALAEQFDSLADSLRITATSSSPRGPPSPIIRNDDHRVAPRFDGFPLGACLRRSDPKRRRSI